MAVTPGVNPIKGIKITEALRLIQGIALFCPEIKTK